MESAYSGCPNIRGVDKVRVMHTYTFRKSEIVAHFFEGFEFYFLELNVMHMDVLLLAVRCILCILSLTIITLK